MRRHAPGCFACADVARGLRIRTIVGAGGCLHAIVRLTGEHQGAPGLAHGGLLAGAFDEVFGNVSVLVHRHIVTGGLEVLYRRPVPVNSTIHLMVQVEAEAGRRLFLTGAARLNRPDGPIVVEARAVYFKREC